MRKILNWLINKSLPFQYRLVSLMATSTVYWMKEQDYFIGKKLLIVALFSTASFILSYLYENNRSSKKKILYLVLLETLCINLVILSSLGLESPYIWYALNSILIASLELRAFYSYLIIAAYGCCFALPYLVDSQLKAQMEGGLISSYNLLLGIFLAVGAIQLIAKYNKAITDDRIKLYEFNRLLLNTNDVIKEIMGNTIEATKSAYYFQTQNDKGKLIEYLMGCVRTVCRTEQIIFFEDAEKFLVTESLNKKKKQIISELSKKKEQALEAGALCNVFLGKMQFIISPIRTGFNTRGLLGIQIDPFTPDDLLKEKEERLKLVSVLCVASFERFELEGISKKILINNEQNRIADEIHDGVLQKLFGASCSVYRLRKSLEAMGNELLEEEASNISDSINESMKDLRAVIYGLSSHKKGNNTFINEIETHLNGVQRLHKINIERQIDGDDALLTVSQKRVVYKIICESIGNAVRHGNATFIRIVMNIGAEKAQITIADNGKGFDYDNAVNSPDCGLGLFNMNRLVNSINGEFCIESDNKSGTVVALEFSVGRDSVNHWEDSAGENFNCG